jgi:yecA family protein
MLVLRYPTRTDSMTLDEIREELQNAQGLPARALSAAVTQASALAPEIIALIDKATRGVFLMPKQENLLFFGLHAVAAARETSVYRPLIALLRLSELQLERLFGYSATEISTRLLLALFDGDADPLFSALENPATDGRVRWSLFQVLARLTWDGRIPRDRMIDLLDRFDREDMAPPADAAWEGWQDAVMYLGLADFESRVRQAWKMERMIHQSNVDQKEWLKLFRRSINNPEDPQLFIHDRVVPVDDPVASLAWLARAEPKRKADGERNDPAEGIELSPIELGWLADFLVSDQTPDLTMSLDMVDGFFTGLITGPDATNASDYLDKVWNVREEERPAFDGAEQARFVTDLLTRHWNTIAARLQAGVMHPTLIDWDDAEDPNDSGRGWAAGFLGAMSFGPENWRSVVEDEDASATLDIILDLAADEFVEEAEPVLVPERTEIIDALPALVLALYNFRRHGTPIAPPAAPASSRSRSFYAPQEPVRVGPKIGRNEPCPCGSGRKYKKCCGAAA